MEVPHVNSYVYTMSKDETRRRILDAVVELHEEVGPAATTITAIAERAGVQRLTVYRHFPDERALVHGCSSHWAARHPAPDPGTWAGIPDPRHRLERALEELYGYYRAGRGMLEKVLRDELEVPALAEVMAPWRGYVSEVVGGLAAGWGAPDDRQPLIRAAVGHAVEFTTWQSLAGQGLTDRESAALMLDLVAAVAQRSREPSGSPG